MGESFRRRYIATASQSREDALSSAPIAGLSSDILNNDQLFVQTPNDQYYVASAQAFLQGFYPPFNPGNSTGGQLDPSSITNDTFVDAPMGGYQYVQLLTLSERDPEVIFLEGQAACPMYESNGLHYQETDEFIQTQRDTSELFRNIGQGFLGEDLPPLYHDYAYAYQIYDIL